MSDQRIKLLEAENERLKKINQDFLDALERLASFECFVNPGLISPECRARMKYAETAINKPRP